MRESTIYQNKIEKLLTNYFSESEVETEWAVSRRRLGNGKPLK